MLNSFNVEIPNTIIGMGTVQSLGQTAQMFNPSKILLITDKGIVKAGIINKVKDPIEACGLIFDIFDEVKEMPTAESVENLNRKISDGDYDLLIGVGGGSTMDSTKVASITSVSGFTLKDFLNNPFFPMITGRRLPKILIPTTAGTGAEWSNASVIYQHEPVPLEYVLVTFLLLPDKVIIDPELTISLPQKVTADSGFDALVHAIEAFINHKANLFSDALCEKAISTIALNIREAYAKGSYNKTARYNMSVASALAMNAVGSSGMGLAHFLNEIIQMEKNLSHGTALAIITPAVMDFNKVARIERFAKLAKLMGEKIQGLSVYESADLAITSVKRIIKDLGLPCKLREVGINEAGIPEMTRRAMELKGRAIEMINPRDADFADIEKIFKNAY